jgi:hypothetical protein
MHFGLQVHHSISINMLQNTLSWAKHKNDITANHAKYFKSTYNVTSFNQSLLCSSAIDDENNGRN